MTFDAFNHFDFPIDRWLNSCFGKHVLFDDLVGYLNGFDLFNSVLLICAFWWCWFRSAAPAERTRDREHVVLTLASGVISIVVARALALGLPFRVRPRFEPALHFVLPDAWNSSFYADWSSFPSDNAMMFATLATGLFFISWRVGLLAMIYVPAVICFPRIYLGLHYPTDILVGLLLGTVCGYFGNQASPRRWLAAPALRWELNAPASFYTAFFLLTYEFATLFTSVRGVAQGTVHLIQRMVNAR
jgi:undecaprenyl-diphosphatase